MKVDNYKAYHLYKPNPDELIIGNTYDTADIPQRCYDGDAKNYVEQHLENVRKKYFANYPSRYNCLYVCDKKHVRYWYNYFSKRNERCVIYEVLLNGNLFWSYAELLRIDGYWTPSNKDYVEKEGLFVGKYKILKTCEISSFDDVY